MSLPGGRETGGISKENSRGEVAIGSRKVPNKKNRGKEHIGQQTRAHPALKTES